MGFAGFGVYTTTLIASGCAKNRLAGASTWAALGSSLGGAMTEDAALHATAECVGGLLDSCEAAFTEHLARKASSPRQAHNTSSASGNTTKPFCGHFKDDNIQSLTLHTFYETKAEAGSLFTASALREMCAFEQSVVAYADKAGYCQRWGASAAGLGGACCPARSLGTALSYLFQKPCAQISDAELAVVGDLLRQCDGARAQSCLPRWKDQHCTSVADCVRVDPSCHANVVACDAGRCVDKCEIPYGGMAAPMRGREAQQLLHSSTEGDFFGLFMYRWLDAGFVHSGKSRYSRADFPFVSTLHRKDGEDMSMVKSKRQMLPLYSDVLLPAATDSDAKVLKVCFDGVLKMDIVQKTLVHDVLHVVVAVAVVFMAIWAHTESLFLTTAGMFHVLMAFPSAYSFYTIVLGLKWMPLTNYIGVFIAIGVGADDIFVYTDAWQQGRAMLPADCPLDRRITWTMRRAGSAMLVTSFTTCAAFLTNVVNYVVPMQLFGIFMGEDIPLPLPSSDALFSVFPACLLGRHRRVVRSHVGGRWNKPAPCGPMRAQRVFTQATGFPAVYRCALTPCTGVLCFPRGRPDGVLRLPLHHHVVPLRRDHLPPAHPAALPMAVAVPSDPEPAWQVSLGSIASGHRCGRSVQPCRESGGR